MAKSSREAKVSLRLIIDEEKNKVVLAEAGKDFVQVLLSFLTLPMGTIVRLLEKHQKSDPVTIGCFSNLYRSVADMKIDDFKTEACKQILLYPRSVGEDWCRTLKLNINPNEGFKCFVCPSVYRCHRCSNFNISFCKCGKLMNIETSFLEGEQVSGSMKDNVDGSSFIITDDLKVTVDSTSTLLKTLQDLGCADVSKLRERVLDVGIKEVLTLLQCVFSSNVPLTDTFLKNQPSPNPYRMTSLLLDDNGDEAEPDKVITFDAIVKKKDKKIMFVECGEDFVNLLFTFLVIPLETTWEISGNSNTLGCVGNLCRSFKDLRGKDMSSSKCVLPYYYSCQKQLLIDIVDTPKPPRVYLSDGILNTLTFSGGRSRYTNPRMTFVDPKSDCCDKSEDGSGFVKRGTKFTVSDDLIVTPKKSSSTFSVLKKLQIHHTDDLEVQAISISKAEALNLLRASLVTSSALSSTFRNLIVCKRKVDRWNSASKKPKVET